MLRRPFISPRARHGVQAHLRRLSTESSIRKSDPLRILFCGSDHFSCTSLKALHDEHQRGNRELIKSIDVMIRPGKPFGRGHRPKVIHDVPLKTVAEELSLNIHERDTFTGWQMPRPNGEPVNLIVAVSFGLFVPPRLLREAKYGGLNVHPSLLPDFRGPAPLHHTLLRGRTHTGVSVQTLSEHTFDAGAIRAQTPYPPGLPVPAKCTVQQLHDLLAPLGASMLVDVLRKKLHAPPHQDVGWIPSPEEAAQLVHAPKIQLADRQVLWAPTQTSPGHTATEVETRARVLGRLWSYALLRDGNVKRVILEDVRALPVWPPVGSEMEDMYTKGRAVFVQEGDGADPRRTAPANAGKRDRSQVQKPFWLDGHAVVIPLREGFLSVGSITVEGDNPRPAAKVIQSFSEEPSGSTKPAVSDATYETA